MKQQDRPTRAPLHDVKRLATRLQAEACHARRELRGDPTGQLGRRKALHGERLPDLQGSLLAAFSVSLCLCGGVTVATQPSTFTPFQNAIRPAICAAAPFGVG